MRALTLMLFLSSTTPSSGSLLPIPLALSCRRLNLLSSLICSADGAEVGGDEGGDSWVLNVQTRLERHSLQAVELSQWFQAAVQIVSNLPAPSNGGPIYRFWACGPAGWLALLLTKAGDVETNPGPTTLNKKVWICDICHK